MKKHKFYPVVLFLISLMLCLPGFSQVGIGISFPDSSSMLDITSTTKGFLPPRLTTTQRTSLGAIAVDGLMVYDTNLHAYFFYKGGSTNAWEQQFSSTTGWSLTGNSGINPSVNFIGTTDGQDLVFKVNNQNAGRLSTSATTLFGYQAGDVNTAGHNTFVGWGAGKANTNGDDNIALGYEALVQNTVGIKNIAIGNLAMCNVINSYNNIAIGYGALASGVFTNGGTPWNGFNLAIGNGALEDNQPGSTINGIQNTAIGHSTLSSNTKGASNTAVGYRAMFNNTTAGRNVAVGYGALYSQSDDFGGNSYSTNNTAIGNEALYSNQPAGSGNSGSNNTATGYRSLYSNTTGYMNVANGTNALYFNIKGPENSAIGYNALQNNTNAGYNVAVGNRALQTQSFANGSSVFVSGNTAIGYNALQFNQPTSTQNGVQNTAVGFNALMENTTGYNNTAFGSIALLWNTVGNNNTAVGIGAFSSTGVLYNNSTALGALAQISADNQVKLGNDSVTSLICTGAYAATTSNGPNLYVDDNGQFFRSTSGGSGWLINGNTGINPSTDFIGTTDAQPLVFKTNSAEAMRIASEGDITMTSNVQVDGKLTTTGGLFVGPASSGIASIITNAVALDCPNLAGQSSAIVTATFSDVSVNSTVFISPQNALPGSVVIAHARISAANTLEVKFTNAGATSEDPPEMTYYVTVFY